MKNLKLKFIVPLLALSFALSSAVGFAQAMDYQKAPVEQLAPAALHSAPVALEVKEAYKLDDAEYKGVVAAKSNFGSTRVLLFGFLAIAVAWFASLFRKQERFPIGQAAFSLAIVSVVAYQVFFADAGGYALAELIALPIANQLKALKEERSAKITKMDALVDKAEAEKRDLNAEEKTAYDALKVEVDGYAARLARLEDKLTREKDEAASNGLPISPTDDPEGLSKKEKRDLSKFSMVKIVRSQAPNHFPDAKLDGLEAEMHQEAVKEARANGGEVKGIGVPAMVLRSWGESERRDMTAGTGNQGGFFVQTDVDRQVIDPLRARLVTAQAGARFLSQLQGNLDIPKSGGVSVAWATENATAAESTPTIGRVQLTPKRLAGFSDLSVLLIKQSSPDVEQMVRQDNLNALAVALDAAAINGPGSGGAPLGILGTAGIGDVIGGTNGLAPTNVHITSLEEKVAIDNADFGSLHYITNPKVRRKLKNTPIESGDSLRVWDRMDRTNPLNGYPALITNNMPSNLTKGTSSGVCSAILFGNFADLLIGMWGGMDVQSNPYTKLKEGQIEVVASVYADVAVRRAESFAAMLDALTT